MALVIADRVRETSTTTGTGSFTLAGAYTGFQSFSAAIGNGNSTYYTIANVVTGEWEVGIGSYTSASNTLSRTTVLASSNAGSAVNFTAGAKDVFVTQPAERSLLVQSAGSGLFSGVAAFTSNGVPYADSTSTLTTGSALTFDGTTLSSTGSGDRAKFGTSSRSIYIAGDSNGVSLLDGAGQTGNGWYINGASSYVAGYIGSSEQMRLTSTGLGIGTSSPARKLVVIGSGAVSSDFIAGYLNANANVIASANVANGGAGYSQFLFGNTSTDTRGYLAYSHASDSLLIGTYGGTKATIDSSGNLGLGVTPSAVSASDRVLQVRNFLFDDNSNGYGIIRYNNYYDGTNDVYLNTGAVSAFQMAGNAFRWYQAASGTAGAAVSFTQAMTLDADGRLKLSAQSTAPNDATGFWLSNVAGVGPVLSGLNVTFQTGATGAQSERARIDSSGNFGIGTSSPGYRLEAYKIDGSGLRTSPVDVAAISAAATTTSEAYNGFGASLIFKSANYTSATPVVAARIRNSINDNSVATNGSSIVFDVTSTRGGSLVQAMELNYAGNLGLGVTPSAWRSAEKAFQVGVSTALTDVSLYSVLRSNNYVDSPGTERYITNGYASAYVQNSGKHWWLTAPSGTADSTITFTQAMTLDASGNLLLGTTTNPDGRRLRVYGIAEFDGNGVSLQIFRSSGTSIGSAGQGNYVVSGGPSDGFGIQSQTALVFGSGGNTERARITSSGDLLVGTTTTTNGALINWYKASGTIETSLGGITTAQNHIVFANPNGNVGSIQVDGSATSYNTSSDYRLKENQQPLTGSGAFIDALKPKTWNWKADGSKGVGFIAHEVQEVSPGSVVGEKDGEQMQAMEYGSAEFIANIIAELQSLRARVAQLEAKGA